MNGKLEEIKAAIKKGESGQPLTDAERVLLKSFVDRFPDLENFPDSQVILPENLAENQVNSLLLLMSEVRPS
jgi:hypothetical protein